MIFIAVKFSLRPDVADQWLARVAPCTAATRAEPGNLFFAWSRSVASPHQFVLLEAFRDRAAGEAHVHSAHFQAAMAWMPDAGLALNWAHLHPDRGDVAQFSRRKSPIEG